MQGSIRKATAALIVMALAALGACGDGDDDGGTPADKIGVGSVCSVNEDCFDGQSCLSFKGGYCGLAGCASDLDCPGGSACAIYEGANYCFRICSDKPDCNRNRPPTLEANCSSSIQLVAGKNDPRKVCQPPSG
jgi:hypothetical protein